MAVLHLKQVNIVCEIIAQVLHAAPGDLGKTTGSIE